MSNVTARALLSTSLLALALACRPRDLVAPASPDDWAGEYWVERVNGQALPATLHDRDGGRTFTVHRAELRLEEVPTLLPGQAETQRAYDLRIDFTLVTATFLQDTFLTLRGPHEAGPAWLSLQRTSGCRTPCPVFSGDRQDGRLTLRAHGGPLLIESLEFAVQP